MFLGIGVFSVVSRFMKRMAKLYVVLDVAVLAHVLKSIAYKELHACTSTCYINGHIHVSCYHCFVVVLEHKLMYIKRNRM
jgi:hypothetical protein